MLLALVASATLVAACGSNLTAREVVDDSTPVICEKSKECSGPALFAIAYPGGVDECVSKTKVEVGKKYGNDLDKSSVCTEDELDKCLEDFKKAACGAGGKLPPIPCNC